MIRVRIAPEDLAKVRIGAALGPFAETVFSLDALQRGPSRVLFGDWRRALSTRLGGNVIMLADLVPRAWVFDLVTIVGRVENMEESLEAFRRAPRQVLQAELAHTANRHCPVPPWAGALLDRDGRGRAAVAGALHHLHQAAVEPYWDRTSALLHAEQARLARVMTERGVGEMLASLHPTILWEPPMLKVRNPALRVVERTLQGRGLVVVPSLFCPPGYPICMDLGDPTTPYVLTYPATREPARIRALWRSTAEPSGNGSLAALMGRTRARTLETIAEATATTSELAARCGISLASASEHATVLRRAGLIHTERFGSAVLHSITPVGAELLTRPSG